MSDTITIAQIRANLSEFVTFVRAQQEDDGIEVTFSEDSEFLAGSVLFGQILSQARYDFSDAKKTDQVVTDAAHAPDVTIERRAAWLAQVSDTYATESSVKTAKRITDRSPNAAAKALAQNTVLWPVVRDTLAAEMPSHPYPYETPADDSGE